MANCTDSFKLPGFEYGVTVLGNLPAPTCTPAHSTACDIAGKGIANVSATVQAFKLACAMARARVVVYNVRSEMARLPKHGGAARSF